MGIKLIDDSLNEIQENILTTQSYKRLDAEIASKLYAALISASSVDKLTIEQELCEIVTSILHPGEEWNSDFIMQHEDEEIASINRIAHTIAAKFK